MNIRFSHNKPLLPALAGCLLFASSSGAQASNNGNFPSQFQDSCPYTESDFNSSMVKINLPELGPIGPFYDTSSGLVYVFPYNGPDFSGGSNCDFFQWAAQMFLWSTSTVSDAQNLPSTIASPSSATPYVFNSEFFYRYSNGTLTPQTHDSQGQSTLPAFSVRKQKPMQLQSADEGFIQPGSAQGILISQGANQVSQKPSLVYYGIHTNRVVGYINAQNKLTPNSYDEFPTSKSNTCKAISFGMSNGYAKDNAAAKFIDELFCPALSNITSANASQSSSSVGIPDLEPAIDLLSMAMELKTSWVEADSVKDKSLYVLQNASVPVFTPKQKSDGSTYWQQTGVQSKELALVGMHVVGSVKGHPEMIWATIEHKNNAPDSAYSYLDKNGNSKTQSAAYGSSPQSPSNWLFSDGSATNQNSQTAELCSTHPNDICPVQGANNISSTNVTRTNPWGVKSSDSDSAKVASQLLSTNANIFGALLSFNQATGSSIKDPRVNYYVAGANWVKGGNIPTSFTSTGQGSPYLANSTMETFEQHQGCFGCHSATVSSAQKVNKFSTSHIYQHINKVIKLQD